MDNRHRLYTVPSCHSNNLEKAKEKAEGRDIDILITDFNLADEESMNFPMYIRRYNPSCSIIIYTNKNDPEHLLEALNMKVDNYIIKLSCFKELIKAIINLAEHAFTLKALYSIVPEKSTHLDTEAYDTISQTIDELRTIIAKMAARHCIESMPIIHSLKGIIMLHNKILYLGRLYDFKLKPEIHNTYKIDETNLIIYAGRNFLNKDNLIKFYHQQASYILPARAYMCAEKIKLEVKAVKTGVFKSCWGSCGAGIIKLNERLILSPLTTIDSLKSYNLPR